MRPGRRSILRQMLALRQFFRRRYDYRNAFHFMDHQLCHAAETFFTSPFERAAILVMEASSEGETTLFARGEGRTLTKLDAIKYPDSIGLLYLCVTEYLGFKENSGEGKVMGLASYGQPTYREAFDKVLRMSPDGRIALDMSYFDVHLSKQDYITRKFIDLFGPRRPREGPMEQRHMDIAASLQAVTEEAGALFLRRLFSLHDVDNVCLTGGVALNSVMNGKLQDQWPNKQIYISPVPHDAGTSLGAALLLNATYNPDLSPFVPGFTPFMGPGYTDEEIEAVLRSKGLRYSRPEDPMKATAEALARQQIVGWFQGRMEAGPRALGCRSILADPRRAEMKDILNAKVKHRESFRPFAPSVLIEKASEYFETHGFPVPYMLKVFPVVPDKRQVIPAVTHVDGSARLQTIAREDNPLYWNLINEFYRLTGCPVVVNTSFNVRGQPIVCSPRDAVDCFLGTQIDVLSIGSFLVRKDA
jgi:carbamoyltransferase